MNWALRIGSDKLKGISATSGRQDMALPLGQQDMDAKQHALIAYILMILGLFTGLLWFAGGIWAIIKQSDAAHTRFADHYENLVKTFVIGFVLSVVGGILTIVLVGWLILAGVFIWSAFKLVKGMVRLSADQAYRQ
ncbi:DUF4870 family protein [Alteromonas sp. CYL-A6]|uniref:DUF4870 family protein n=1 Tax=Alteromonas nitratireducens TaxID=3390813 RepID=UPI0034AD2AF6